MSRRTLQSGRRPISARAFMAQSFHSPRPDPMIAGCGSDCPCRAPRGSTWTVFSTGVRMTLVETFPRPAGGRRFEWVRA